MKHKPQSTHTNQESVPPAPTAGLTTASTKPAVAASQSEPPPLGGGQSDSPANWPPAHAGGSDSTDAALAQLRAENEALKRELREQAAHASLKDKLKQAGARTPKLLLEAAKHALQFTAAGELENAVEIIEALKEKFPEQFGASKAPAIPSIDAGAGRVSKPSLTREALSKMSPAEVAQLDWNDVRRVLASR